jgi:peptidoglycan/xylan/chitin deacetylase (PgdA/CDA1 family)
MNASLSPGAQRLQNVEPCFGVRCNAMTLSSSAALISLTAGICAWGAYHPSAELFGKAQRRTGRARTIALTFDDGPNPSVTPQLLDLLERYDARATFFLIGRHVRACPALAAEIAARGHSIGNHTDTHPNLLWQSRRRILEELERCDASIADATGRRPRIMRPPYGCRRPQVHTAARDAGHGRPVLWSRSARDWTPQPAAQVIRRLRAIRAGDIVLLHDGFHAALGADRQHTVRALEYWLPRWKAQGLACVTVGAVGHQAS